MVPLDVDVESPMLPPNDLLALAVGAGSDPHNASIRNRLSLKPRAS